jgi:hypothetical protein
VQQRGCFEGAARRCAAWAVSAAAMPARSPSARLAASARSSWRAASAERPMSVSVVPAE